MPALLRHRSLALVGALALGLLGSALGPACLVPDYCIVVASEGADWCMQVSGALMWPEGQPELAESVGAEGSLPDGCVCMNDGEDLILSDQEPAEVYADLHAEVEEAARQACVDLVPPGYVSNCLATEAQDEIPAPVLAPALQGPSSRACIGACAYANEPPFGEPCGEPDPWECNGEEPPGAGDTGAEDTGDTGDTGGAEPFLEGSVAR